MGLPVIAAAGLGLQAIGTIAGIGGQAQQGRAQQEMYNYQAQVARNNATIAGYNVQYATEVGQAKAEQTGLKFRATEGSQLAAQAAQGVSVNTGSPVDVRATTREVGRLAELTDITDAARVAYGYKVQATSDLAQAGLDVAAGQGARSGSVLGAFGSAASGAGGLAQKYLWMQNYGGAGGGGGTPATFSDDAGLAAALNASPNIL